MDNILPKLKESDIICITPEHNFHIIKASDIGIDNVYGHYVVLHAGYSGGGSDSMGHSYSPGWKVTASGVWGSTTGDISFKNCKIYFFQGGGSSPSINNIVSIGTVKPKGDLVMELFEDI
jgi:hypothetical protein